MTHVVCLSQTDRIRICLKPSSLKQNFNQISKFKQSDLSVAQVKKEKELYRKSC